MQREKKSLLEIIYVSMGFQSLGWLYEKKVNYLRFNFERLIAFPDPPQTGNNSGSTPDHRLEYPSQFLPFPIPSTLG